MNQKTQKILTLALLSSTAFLLSACTPNLPFKNLFKKELEQSEQATEQEKESPFSKEKTEVSRNSLSKLLRSGDNLKCTTTQKINEEKYMVTLYIADGKTYVESELPASMLGEEEAKAYVIYRDNTLYTWSDVPNIRGIKSSVNHNDKGKENITLKNLENLVYECESWAEVNMDLFEIPEDVNFTEIGNNMNSENTVPNEENLCDSCSNIEDEVKRETCLKTLECN